jgi:hydrophobic/amphiphilic exporter-1 (mainly G- bacteria), HAE1 family
MSIARFAVNRRVAVSMIALAIVVLGVFALPRLPVALLPNFTPPVVTVTVDYPNVGPEQMEALVTRPIENAVSRVNGIELINSSSQLGTSSVSAQFYYGTNIDTAAVDVQQQVDQIRSQLPNDPNLQQPQIAKFNSNNLPVVRFYVTDTNMPLRDLVDLFSNQLSDEFASVDGVANVIVNQDQARAFMIESDADKLAAYGMTFNQIIGRVQQENLNLPAGIVQVGPNEYQVQANALLSTANDISNLVLAVKNGSVIRIGTVARVTDSIEEQRTFERLNGKQALGVVVDAQPDANIVATAIGTYRKIDQIQARYAGMKIGVVFDQQSFILEAINALEHTAIYGAILAVVIILLFLHSWRTTLIVAISLPISVLGALFVGYVAGYSLNIMTLGGLALAVGLIVDDAIVVIENIYRHMALGQSPRNAAESATTEIFTAVLASSITVITVFIPLVLIPGLQGLIFTPFAVMVMAAVAISFVVAVTTVPMLSSILLRNKYMASHGASNGNGGTHGGGIYTRFARGFDRVYDRFERWYRAILERAIARPGLVVGIAAILLVVTIAATKLGAVKTEIFPASNSVFVRYNIIMPTGTALNVTNEVSRDIENRMMKDPRVLLVGSQIGQQGYVGSGTLVTNQINLSVQLKPQFSGNDAAKYVRDWTKIIDTIPGAQPFGRTVDIVQNTISQGQDALDVQVFGPDISTLYNLAQFTVVPRLSRIPGIQTPQNAISLSQPELDINVDRVKAAQLGISTQAISNTIDTATSGTIASYMQINGTQYPIVVQLPPDQRRSLQSVLSLQVPVSNLPGATTGSVANGAVTGSVGGAIVQSSTDLGASNTLPVMALRELASISFGAGPSEITRQDKLREIDVFAGLDTAPLGAVVDATTKIMNGLTLPPGYYWQYGQSVTQQSDTFGSLGLIVLLAIILIYMLLAAQFESLLHPLVIMVSVPLASTGVVLSLWLTHRAFGLTAFIGVLMLVGIVVKNAILVVEFTNQLRERGYSVKDAVLHAAPLRLRPILMTTLASVGGMLPIALGIESGSQTQAPLGAVVIGGLLFSTTLSLLVVPTLYLWVAQYIEPRLGGFRRGEEKPAAIPSPGLVPADV